MERARRRLRIWLIMMVVLAAAAGIFYYYYGVKGNEDVSGGTLVYREAQENTGNEIDVRYDNAVDTNKNKWNETCKNISYENSDIRKNRGSNE